MYERDYNKTERKLLRVLAANIKRARNESCISLRDAAKRLSEPASKLSEIENGKKMPSVVQLGKFAQLYEVPVGFFYSGRESDIGEEKYFEVSRMIIPLREEMNMEFNRIVGKLCAASFPAEDVFKTLLQEQDDFIKQGKRMIEQNYNEAWQDIKGGQNFAIKLAHLENRANIAKEALYCAGLAKKQIKDDAQMGLF